jgi:sec-independent protein translocase protein TatA
MEPTSVLTAGPFNLGAQEILIIGLVAVILFGGKKLSEVGKGLGEGIRNFKSALKGEEDASKHDQVEEKK